jgi:hypothetical protein
LRVAVCLPLEQCPTFGHGPPKFGHVVHAIPGVCERAPVARSLLCGDGV